MGLYYYFLEYVLVFSFIVFCISSVKSDSNVVECLQYAHGRAYY